MSKPISYQHMVGIVSSLHSFIDEAENAIATVYANFSSSKDAVVAKHTNDVNVLTSNYNAQHNGIKAQAQKMIDDAQEIFDEISKLEEQLSSSDKYFVKTKIKKEQELLGKSSERYDDSPDYFEILNDIKSRFQSLVVKYSNRGHRGIVDGINYMVSSQRKQDYEELIVLKNTVSQLINEINETIPSLTNDSLSTFDEEFVLEKGNIERQYETNLGLVQQQFDSNIDSVADQICQRLDEIIPDVLIDELKDAIDQYDSGYGKLDAQRNRFGSYIILGYLSYPFADFIESPVLVELLRSKCEKLVVNNTLRLPIMCSLNGDFNWIIENNDITTTDVAKMTHSLMFGFLSFSPISKVNFCICDLENRGNSIIPFLELKKKVPEMFMGKVLTTQEEIHERLYQLSCYIDDFIQNKLGNRYNNIFEYNEANQEDIAPITVIVIYDFPKGFDDRNIAELKNILRNGNKCGIYALICHNTKAESNGFTDQTSAIASITEQCTRIMYEQSTFWLNGLEIALKTIPSSDDINSFADKYMLIMEGRKNKGLVFPTLLKRVMGCNTDAKLHSTIDQIVSLQKEYSSRYGFVDESLEQFPDSVMLGSIDYPAEIFTPGTAAYCLQNGLSHNVCGRNNVSIPFTCELDDRFNVFLLSNEDTEKQINELSHSMLMSFFSSFPVGKVNVSVFDPEKRGNSIIPFLDFRKKLPDTFDNQIYTSQESICDKLNKLNVYIDEFIQDKLGNGFANIVEYNMNSSANQAPVQVIVIYDFPKCFDNQSYEAVLNIMKNGSKCGVYTIICYNPNITVSRYDNHEEYIEQIKKLSTCFEWKDGHYVLAPYNLELSVNTLLSQSELQEFVTRYSDKSNRIKSKGLSFGDILAKEHFSCSAAKNLSIPMGVGAGNAVVNLIMGEGASHHGLIAGATGSGKSTLLHTIIMSAMLNYSPEQLNLYLMDFKSGTEFKIYETVKLPHIKLLALDAMQEFGESILEDLVSEMTRRGELFKTVGQTSLKGYSESTGKTLPRILVIMDEFQILFNDSTNRKIAMNCAELTKRIVTEGRAFGIHLLMATQSTKVIRDLTLQQGTIEQMRIRIGLKCGEDDARYLFSDRNDTKALEMMKGPIGTAVLNEEYTEQSNVGFRAAYCDKETQNDLLQLIACHYQSMDEKPQIFEGNRTVQMLDYLSQAMVSSYASSTTKIFFGEKIKVAPPFVLDVDRRKKHNMLICGTNERMAENIANNYMISILLNSNNELYCMDGDIIVGDSSFLDVYEAFEAFSDSFHLAYDRSQIITTIHTLFDIYKANKTSSTNQNVFVFIKNLQWLDIVQRMLKDESIDEDEYVQSESVETQNSSPFDFGADLSKPTESVSYMLRKMIDDGSSCGIYIIISCTEYPVVKECLYYADNILAKIPDRIIFSLSDNDADNLIDGVSVSQMKDNTVYFSDGVKNTFQFKPFVVSGIDDIKSFCEKFKKIE